MNADTTGLMTNWKKENVTHFSSSVKKITFIFFVINYKQHVIKCQKLKVLND